MRLNVPRSVTRGYDPDDPDVVAALDRLRAEMEFLTEQLASAMGIGGAARRVGGPSERARSAVTQNIRSTLKRLVQALPVLDESLARRIRTGTFCAYEPDPSRPVAWQL